MAPAVCAALLTSTARAQTDSEGPLHATPAMILVGSGTVSSSGALADNLLHRKRAGFVPFVGESLPLNPAEPRFTTAELFGGGSPPPFTVNALSVGLDVVLAQVPSAGQSRIQIPPQAWGALLFSVTRATPGEAGSLIATEQAALDGAGADLFTLTLPGSDMPASVLPCYPQDAPQRSLDSTEMDLFDGVNEGEISAVDYYIPLYTAGNPIRPRLPDNPTVFFSVAHDDVFPAVGPSTVPAAWFPASTPSSATILRTTWDPFLQAWSTPQEHLPYTALGLDLEDDIDALAVDMDQRLILFSIVATGTSTLDEQLQIAHYPPPPPGGTGAADGAGEAGWAGGAVGPGDGSGDGGGTSVGVYVTEDGTESVASRLRMGRDGDVDSTCTIDPGEQGDALSLSFGSPVATITPLKIMPSGVYRDERIGGPTLTATVSGVSTTASMPLQRLELRVGVPLGGGGYTLLPTPVYFEILNGTNPSGNRDVSLTTGLIGTFLGVDVDFFWVSYPAAIKPSSALLRVGL